MLKEQQIYRYQDIEFRIVYSRRRTLGISVLPDSSVIVRAPYRASLKTINRIVQEKADWIIKHRDNYREKGNQKTEQSLYLRGDTAFQGKRTCTEELLNPKKPFIRFNENTIELGLDKPVIRTCCEKTAL